MRFNLLRFLELPRDKNTKYLWLSMLSLIGVIIFSIWQIIIIKNSADADKSLNLQLQAKILELNKINNSQKQNIEEAQKSSRKITRKEIISTDNNFKIQTVSIPINYANAQDLVIILRDKNNALLSDKANVIADSRTNVLWLQELSHNISKVVGFIKALDTPKKQVLIEARIVTMARDSAEDLGVRFGFLQNKDTSTQNNPAGKVGFDLSAIPLAANPANIGLAIAMLGKSALLDLELSALQSEGRAKIIASPRLITTNQEPAVIQSGEDIPYQRLTVSGGTSVAFKKAVLSLKVVPKITFDGKLIMSISINQDTDSGRRVQGVPIISTKYLETKVMIADNQTIVLGGIYKEDKNSSIIRVPILGTLPWLGGLFRRTDQKYSNEELLIFLTPKILGAINN